MCETKPPLPTLRVTCCHGLALSRNELADCTTSMGDVVRRTVGPFVLCLLAVVGGAVEARAAAPKPGELQEMKARSDGKEMVIRFRFCPPGSLEPGRPKSADDDGDKADDGGLLGALNKVSKVKFNGFFLTETEITISQASVLLGKDAFVALRDRLISSALGEGEGQESNKYLVDALKSGSGDYPIFGVTLNEAVAMCRRLSELTKDQVAGDELSIETRQFRLPSHAEWQYACRGKASEAEAKKFPHFSHWTLVEGLNKDLRADWGQLVKEMPEGNGNAGWTGSQFEVVEALEAKKESKIPIQVLHAILLSSMKFSRDFAKGVGTAPFVEVLDGTPNGWGILHMHDNVNEWTLTEKEPDKIWDKLTTPPMQNTKVLFLAGGNNLTSAMQGEGAWKILTIWGGYPMDLKTGSLSPLSVAQGNDFPTTVNENLPGVRMLLARRVKEEWFAILRRTAMDGDATFQDRRTQIAGIRQTVADIVPGTRAVEMNGFVGFYDGLVLVNSENTEERRAGFKMLTDSCGSLAPKSSGGGGGLAGLLGGGNGGQKKTENPDTLFFRLLKSEIEVNGSPSSTVNPATP